MPRRRRVPGPLRPVLPSGAEREKLKRVASRRQERFESTLKLLDAMVGDRDEVMPQVESFARSAGNLFQLLPSPSEAITQHLFPCAGELRAV
ncbi:hypothetical protein KC333_g128 [Hortaea werneckii]|nr:hypothetical protein KC333_g128 [Hortaea werneckii]